MKLAIWAYSAPGHVGVTTCAASFSGIHALVRAPKGDGYATTMLAMFERLGVTPPVTFAALTEATLAGAAADIPAFLADIEKRAHPEAIVVTRSGTAAVLQEPLDGEIGTIPPGTIKADIIQAGAHPVRDNEQSAFAYTLRELIAYYAGDVRRTEAPSVNILGPSLLGFHDRSNVQSLRAMFAALGITVNGVFPLGASVADLRAIGRAWLNVTTSHETTTPASAYLHERFGIPTVAALPYGEAGTNRFLREVCGHLEIPAARIAHAARDAKLLWFARTVDAHALSSKRVGVFGLPTIAAGVARMLREELDMRVDFVGTYVTAYGDWLRERVADITPNVMVTNDYREVARAIDETRPDIMFGSQMERHSASAFGVPCAVISPPSHILNFPMAYSPFVGYDGANYFGDVVNRTQVLGLEHHLIDMFGPRNQGEFADAMPERTDATPAPHVTAATEVRWDPAAEKLISRVPFFVRKKARSNIERYAREQQLTVIDERTVLAAKEHVGG